MRQIGTISTETDARTLADYLLTIHIETTLQQEGTGWDIWVRDEDQVTRAKEELAAYQANPQDPRFVQAGRAAAELRKANEKAEATYERRQVDFADKFRSRSRLLRPATAILIGTCLVVFVATRFGNVDNDLSQQLFITTFHTEGGYIRFPTALPVFHGQPWRLLTPIFVHFDLWHLAGNMMWLYYLGNMIEARRGAVRLVLMVLVIAAISNLTEYYLGGLTIANGGVEHHYHPVFGGMSGVVFGLFGYVWMKMRFEPELGMALPQQAFILSLLWFVFCFTGLAGRIANGAHAGGLVVGILIGLISSVWRKLRK
jgi:GlpG protein